MRLRAFIDQSSKVTVGRDLFEALRVFVAEQGANLVSYHIVIENLLRVRVEDGFHYNCFPDAWVKRYLERGYFDYDPIIRHALNAREPFHWYDVGRLTTLTPEQEAYLDDMRAFGLVDGLATPIFSAYGTIAYFGVGSDQAPLALSETDILEIQYACNHVHNLFSDMRAAMAAKPSPLSPRETEVLSWVAKGKSNAVIATILGVSDHTVDTLVRRVFQKLEVGDRITAAIKGVGLGLVTL